jgi:hypothetical protein
MTLQKLMKSLLTLGVRDDHAPRLGTKASENKNKTRQILNKCFCVEKPKKLSVIFPPK